MHSSSRQTLLISAFLISIAVVMSASLAAVVDVKLQPLQTLPDKSFQFTLSVFDLAGDNVNKVEIAIPQKDSSPLYTIKEIGNPVGWTYESRYAVGSSSPFKIIWSTSDIGIAAGKSMSFNFVAVAPSAGGDNDFQWKVTDLKSVETAGNIKVANVNTAFSNFNVKVSGSVAAGKSVDVTVTASSQSGTIKNDYAGTVKFSSSDSLAILPSDYTFQPSDNGMRVFKVKFKTAGDQEIKVSDGSIENSAKVSVQQGDASYIQLTLSTDTVSADSIVTFTVLSNDLYGNTEDVTKDSKFDIDKEAKGALSGNTYKTEVLGKWTVVANYNSNARQLSDGKLLTVTNEAVPPKEETKPAQKKVSMDIISEDLVEVPFNSTKTFSVSVRNTGNQDLQNVSVYFTGFSEKFLDISPSIANIEAGKAQIFKVTVSPTEHVSPSDVQFLALSSNYTSEMLNATKTVKINVTEPTSTSQDLSTTGKFSLSKNLKFLGIAIVVAIVLIILFWALFLREEPKKKKSEKQEKSDKSE